jgi:hypothetical protein
VLNWHSNKEYFAAFCTCGQVKISTSLWARSSKSLNGQCELEGIVGLIVLDVRDVGISSRIVDHVGDDAAAL